MKAKLIVLGICATLGILTVVLTLLGMSTFSAAAAAGFAGCGVVFLILRIAGKKKGGKKAGVLPVILLILSLLLLAAAIGGLLFVSRYGANAAEFERNLKSIQNISAVLSAGYGKGGIIFRAGLFLAQYRLFVVTAGVLLMLAALGIMYLSDAKAQRNAEEAGTGDPWTDFEVTDRPAHTAERQNPPSPQRAEGKKTKKKPANQNMGPGNFMSREYGRPEQSPPPQDFGAPVFNGAEQNPPPGDFAPPDFGDMQLPEGLDFQDFGMQAGDFAPSGNGMPDDQGMNAGYGSAGEETVVDSGFGFGQDASGNGGGFADEEMTQMDGQGFPGGEEGQNVDYGLPGIGIAEDHCCICGAPLTEGFAVLFRDEKGKEARIDENCCKLIETICSGTDPREVSDAAAFLQGQQPLVDAAVADALEGYIRSAAER